MWHLTKKLKYMEKKKKKAKPEQMPVTTSY